MTKSESVERRQWDLGNVAFQPAFAQLQPPLPALRSERRDFASREALVHRVHSEFLEMPGLTLSLAQAVRLFSVPSDVCSRVFGELIRGHLMRLTAGARYALAGESH